MALILTTDPPATLPEFAKLDITDDTSLMSNVLEPETSQKNYGWYPFRKRPGRRVMNWLHRHTYNMCKFIKDDFFPEVDGILDSVDGRLDMLETYLPLTGAELTGITASTGDATTISIPSGFTNGNVYVLTAKIQIGAGDNELWYGLGDFFSIGWNTRADEQSIQIHHPDNATYHSKPYKVIIAHLPTL